MALILVNILEKLHIARTCITPVSLRYFVTVPNLRADPPSYKRDIKKANKNRFINKRTREKIRDILGIKEMEALLLVTRYMRLNSTPIKHISYNFEICKQFDIDVKTVYNYPFLLCEAKLPDKLKILQMLPLKLSEGIPLAQTSIPRMNFILNNKGEFMQRINDLCKIFEIDVEKCCHIIAQRPFILTQPLEELEESLKTLYEYRFTKEDILNDLWVFKYSDDFIRSKLDSIKKEHVDSLKTWMIRCPEDTLCRHIKKTCDNRDILGENSVAQYFSEKLNCSEIIARSLIRKHPQLLKKSLTKLNHMFDLLFRLGFPSEQIIRVPKIFLHSTKTTEKRYKELVSLKLHPDNLYVYTKSQKQYLEYISNIVDCDSKNDCSVEKDS